MSNLAIPYHVDAALENGLEGQGISRRDALSLMDEAPLETLLQSAAAVRDEHRFPASAARPRQWQAALADADLAARTRLGPGRLGSWRRVGLPGGRRHAHCGQHRHGTG